MVVIKTNTAFAFDMHQFSCHVGFQFRMFEYMSGKLSVKFVKTIDLA
jgi:hypothetical protein